MELLQLRYFLQLANQLHVTRTAEQLHISQPSLSATIKKLERELGVPLFLRKGRNITLSPYGEAFKRYAEEAFLALDNGKQAVDRLRNVDNRTLNLGLLSPYMWNELFQQFSALYPEVNISRYSIEDHQFFDGILSGKIDLYLGGLNHLHTLDAHKLQYITLYEDELVLLVPSGHRFAGQGEIDLRQCREEHFINQDAGTSLQQFVNEQLDRMGFQPKVMMVCDYTLRDRMVAENHGISITTRWAARKTEAANVTYLTITNPHEKRKLGLVWRRGKEFSQSMEKFYQTACGFYKDTQV